MMTKKSLLAIGAVFILITLLLATGCSSSSSTASTAPVATATPKTSSPTATPQTSTASIQAALDKTKSSLFATSLIADYSSTDKVLDIAITGDTPSGDARLKRNFLEDSCVLMAKVVTLPDIDMVRIKGYTNVVDSKGNEKIGLVYQAVVSDMAKARGANWPNLQYSDTNLIVRNFDSTGGFIMDA